MEPFEPPTPSPPTIKASVTLIAGWLNEVVAAVTALETAVRSEPPAGPHFVETSAGFLNLSVVQHVVLDYDVLGGLVVVTSREAPPVVVKDPAEVAAVLAHLRRLCVQRAGEIRPVSLVFPPTPVSPLQDGEPSSPPASDVVMPPPKPVP